MKKVLDYHISTYNRYSFITIRNNHLEVTLSDLGASIYSIKYNDDLLTLTPNNKEDFLHSNIYHGKTVGRVANRIKGNEIKIGDEIYKLQNNEGENTLHGGINGISTKQFKYKINVLDSSIKVEYTYIDRETTPGFPGNLNLVITYLINKDSLKISFKAKSNKLTMCSLTNHAYYSLGTDSIDDLKLEIKAHKYLHPNPNDLLPLDVKDVDEIMDFSSLREINKYIDNPYLMNSKTKGYDHYYYFDEIDPSKIQLSLISPKYKMDVYTDYPGTQIYSDNYETIEQFNQTENKIRRALAIEPSLSQAEPHFLEKGELYSYFIKLIIKENK